MTEVPVYTEGDGRPDCPACKGRGVVPVPVEQRHPLGVGEQTKMCSCILVRDILANADRGWKGLSKAKPLPSSPLKGREKENLWITCPLVYFQQHMRHVAIRMGPRWGFVVVSDADLMDAWLSKDLDPIEDPDINRRRVAALSPYHNLYAISDPPALLVILMGVKVARNRAMPEVFLEVLHRRFYQLHDKPTWIVDMPTKMLADGHISYDDQVADFLDDWEYLNLTPEDYGETTKKEDPTDPQMETVKGGPRPNVAVADLQGTSTGETRDELGKESPQQSTKRGKKR